MTRKNGSILSPVGTLLNEEADKNFIFLKIFFLDHKIMSLNYILLIYQRKVIKEVLIRENYLNEMRWKKNYF